MKKSCFVILFSFICVALPGVAHSQDAAEQGAQTQAPERAARDRQTVDIFLDDEKLSVEADIPSVDLVMSYKGMQYESQSFKKSFLPELIESSKKFPF